MKLTQPAEREFMHWWNINKAEVLNRATEEGWLRDRWIARLAWHSSRGVPLTQITLRKKERDAKRT